LDENAVTSSHNFLRFLSTDFLDSNSAENVILPSDWTKNIKILRDLELSRIPGLKWSCISLLPVNG